MKWIAQSAKRRLPIILVIGLLMSGCGPKQPVSVHTPKIPQASKILFQNAENAFHQKNYPEALRLYNDYLTRFADQPMAPAAYLKLGMIYVIAEDDTQAVRYLETLIEKYPDNPLSLDARLALLEIRYYQGRYVELLQQADPVLKSKPHQVRAYVLVAQAYMALDSWENAVKALMLADQAADDTERPAFTSQVKELLPNLSSDTLAALAGQLPDTFPKGYVLYYSGLSYMNEGNNELAAERFLSLVEKFPDHEYAGEAEQLLALAAEDTSPGKFRFGCLLPLSGKYQKFGEKALRGIQLALDRFQSFNQHSVVELAIKDTESDPEASVERVRELDELSVSAIIGPIVTVEAAASEAQARQIPMVLLTQKDHVSELGTFIFRNFLTPRMQVKGLVAFSKESLDLSRFAVLYPDEPYGEKFMNLFWDEVVSAGGTIAGVESYDSGLTDFAAPIKKLVGLFYADKPTSDNRSAKTKEYDPVIDFDGLFIPDGPTKAGMIIPQLAYFDVTDIFFMGTNLWHSDKLIRTAGDIAQSSIIPDGFFADSKNLVVKEFVDAYRQAFGKSPGLMEAIAYDTAMILFETLSHYQIRIRSAVPDMLKNLGDYPGVTGITNFDATGEAQKGVYILKVRGNRFQELKYP